jgi:hypothetical protein
MAEEEGCYREPHQIDAKHQSDIRDEASNGRSSEAKYHTAGAQLTWVYIHQLLKLAR